MKHATPSRIADLIFQHVPKNCCSILEPAVGTGSLLGPIIESGEFDKCSITAVDISHERLLECENSFGRTASVIDFQHCSFLDWLPDKKFECVVMNPPFSAKQRGLVTFEGRRCSTESAFLRKGIEHLDLGGTLIAVLPASIVSGDNAAPLRQDLLSTLDVQKVYELNRYSFPGVEGKFFIMVARKAPPEQNVALEKPFSLNNVTIEPRADALAQGSRLDFSFHFAQVAIEQLIGAGNLEVRPLIDIASIERGKISAPNISSGILHTTAFDSGDWSINHFRFEEGLPCAKDGDILVKRVGRNCHGSFGMYSGEADAVISDCVFRISAREPSKNFALLFALRALYADQIGKQLLSKGTGASYITANSLQSAPIVSKLDSLFPDEFAEYLDAERRSDFEAKVQIEHKVRLGLFGEFL